MNEPPADPPPPEGRDPLVFRLIKSVFAPDVLEDGGRDAPLTPRGRLLFWGTIAVLVVAVTILFIVTLAER